ncbi:MAG: hypothetical protein ACKOJF_10780, partial [Planctomycetaceae bacterium]
ARFQRLGRKPPALIQRRAPPSADPLRPEAFASARTPPPNGIAWGLDAIAIRRARDSTGWRAIRLTVDRAGDRADG